MQQQLFLSNSQTVSWLPPPIRVLKVNFDASVNHNKAAVRFVIRNEDGRLIRAGGKTLLPSSVPIAELTAAWLGVNMAINELGA